MQSHPPEISVHQRARRSGRVVRWVGYALPLAAYVSVALLAPTDVLDRVPWLRSIADGTQSTFLSLSPAVDIYKHARSTSFLQVAMLSSTLAVLAVVWMVASMCIHAALQYKHLDAFFTASIRSQKDRVVGLVILPAFGIFCMWAFFCLSGDPSFASGFSTNSRLGYTLLSFAAIFFAGGGIGISVMHARALIYRAFGGEKS